MRVRAEKGLKGFPAGKKYPEKKSTREKQYPGKITLGLRNASRVRVMAEKGLKDGG